jgi:tetratricopeptide (TPR) repeat protein
MAATRWCLIIAALSRAGLLAAQLPAAEEAFRRGQFAQARAGYERVLLSDSLNVRALYRLAVLDSWDAQLDRSLQRFTRLRRLEPLDPDFMVAHARVLSWAGRTKQALALFDSVLTRAPDRADALAGRARVVAWSGDLDRAERLWRDALARHPDDAEILIGLAQTLYWNDQPGLAQAYTARARRLAPGDSTARQLERAVRAALRPDIGSSVDGAGDNEHNDFVAQDATLSGALGSALRGTLRAGWRRATDLAGDGTSYGGGGFVVAELGRRVELRAGAGLRHLSAGTTTRTPATVEVGVGVRPARDVALGLSYSRAPFDETAELMRRGFVLDAAELEFELAPAAGWSISGTTGATWISDGNRQLHVTGGVLARVLPGLQVGPFGRVLAFHATPFDGYFAPNRFAVLEGRAVYAWQRRGWGLRAEAGLGTQQVSDTAAHQTAWHVGVALSRGWGANNELALVGSITNSAGATSTTGTRTEAFRYRTLGVRFRQGL